MIRYGWIFSTFNTEELNARTVSLPCNDVIGNSPTAPISEDKTKHSYLEGKSQQGIVSGLICF